MGTTYMDFGTGSFHVDGDAPLTQDQVDSVWLHLPTTGASWVEKGQLFAQQRDGAIAFNLGPVEPGISGVSAAVRLHGKAGVKKSKAHHSTRKARHHATKKKSPAQLQREIDAALAGSGSSSPFEDAKAEAAALENELEAATKVIKTFPSGPMGLTPDAVRATAEYRAAKTRVDKAFARLREFNAVFVKRFANELRAERAQRTKERESRWWP
jgi:hypothetical protein